MPMTGLAGIRAVLAERRYRTYQAGNSISLMGDWVQRTTVGWLAWELTGQSAWVGLMALADLAPTLLVGPFGGAVADRHELKRIIVICQIIMATTATSMGVLALDGRLTVWLMFGLVLVNGMVTGLAQPARLALISLLVSRENLPTAVAMNSMIFNTARFIGPAIAGLVLATVGPGAAFIVNALTYAAFLAALSRLRIAHTPPPLSSRSFLAEVGEGIAYVARHPGIGPLLLMFALSSILVRPVGELLPGVAAEIFDRGADGFALLSASLGLGAVVAGFWLTQRGGRNLFGLCLGSIAGTCITTLVFVLSPSFWLGVVVALLLGACLTVAGVSAQTLIQLAVAPAYRGRTMALYGLVFRAAPAIGALTLGTLADRLGLRSVLSAGVVVCALMLIAVASRRDRMAAALIPDER